MKYSKGIYFWFALFAVCFISYQLISENIRPYYNSDNLIINYFLGVAPNFFPAIGIPALFLILIPQLRRTNKWLNKKVYLTANIISITGLISWEFIQINSTKLLFDWNDIVWTLIGALVFQLIWNLTPERFKIIEN